MANLKNKLVARCKVLRAPIPKSRDPFVNTPLLSLGPDAHGLERFWISTWNATVGTTCALVNELGEHRLLRPGVPHWGFYSAAQEEEHTLWLCGNLSAVVRLDLRSGKFESFPTGAPAALVFQGMIFDRATGKLFGIAFPPPRTAAFSFDTRERRGVRVYERFTDAHYMRCSFPNVDGTYSSIVHVPGEALVRWDPQREQLDVSVISDRIDVHAPAGTTQRVVSDEAGRYYFPHRGWYDPKTRTFDRSGPRPERELTWFARRGQTVYGVEGKRNDIGISAWELASGHVEHVCDISDTQTHNVNVTASGKIVCVNMYGVFQRFDGRSGALELSRVLPSDAIGTVDCLCRIDERRLLGTPFITQRFWELDLKSGKGFDCGRAAPGAGEILQVWKLGGKLYMAAYTGGELMEYDPAKHPHFPENPRVVAAPPHAMRPVSAADDGRHIFYTCSAPYGQLGSVLVKYDTKTGQASVHHHPIPDQQIQSLCYDRRTKSLLCGTTYHSDCQSCPPSTDVCYLARIGAEDLEVQASVPAPKGSWVARAVGALGQGRWLCTFSSESGTRWAAIDPQALRTPEGDELRAFPEGFMDIRPTLKPGLFLLRVADRIELWDLRTNTCRKTLVKGIDPKFYVYRIVAQGRSVILALPKEILVLENVL